MQPECPHCHRSFNGTNLGYEKRDVSMSNPDLKFIEIFFCRDCNGILTIQNVS